jgi:hypothetical protein
MVTDDSPALPEDVYGMSKWLCEHLGRYYARRWAIPTVALRLGMFVPESFERYGFRLLFGGSMTVMSPTRSYWPWRTIRRGLGDDPAGVLERYWPSCTQLVRDRGLDLDELL